MILDTSTLLWRGLLIASMVTLLGGYGTAVWLVWRSALRPFSRNLLVVMSGIGLLAGGLYIRSWQGGLSNFLQWFLNLDLEYALGTHLSTIQLIMIAVAILVIGLRVPVTHRWQRVYWIVVAAGFAFLGFDEYFQVHESLLSEQRWRLVYGAGGILLVLVTAWMYRRVYPRQGTPFLLLFDGLLILAVSGIVVEFAVWRSFCYDTLDSLVPVCESFDHWLIFEEWFEILGGTIVLAAFILFAQNNLSQVGWQLQKRAVTITGLLTTLGLVVYLWLMPGIEAQIGTQPVNVTYMDGCLSLVSYRLGQERIAPGETINIHFYWRAHDQINTTLRLSLHALAKPDNTESMAQAEEIDMGQYPSKAFLPGMTVRKSVELTFPEDIPTPASYTLMLRVWSGNPERQDLRGVNITQADRPLLTADSLLFDSLPVISTQDVPVPTNSVEYDFAPDGITLAGYTLPNTVDSSLSLNFIWHTWKDVEHELTQFVHLVDDSSGEFVFGFDQSPFGGRLPTSDWPSAMLLADTWNIPLPDDLPTGTYTVYTGLYDALTQDRVQVHDSSGQPVLNNAIALGRVQVVG